MTKTISILGSTGSIGKQALEVIEKLPKKFSVFGLAAGKNIELIKEQINKFKPQVVSVSTEELAAQLSKEVNGVEVIWGEEGLKQIAGNTKNDMVLVSVTGLNGLAPTIAAIENKIDVALANKETLVAAGNIVTKLAKENDVKIIPVDSEHSAIYQCIQARSSQRGIDSAIPDRVRNDTDMTSVRKIILTASGGPFRTKTIADMQSATVESTLAHPRWSMGKKITVDSATLMNKGLEVIEAHWLFGIDYKDIQVVVHPQSVIHGAAEFNDGSVIAQMGLPSMHIPIQYAISYPETFQGIKTGSLDLTQISKLEFEKPDLNKFPCLELAYEAGKKGGTYTTALNAINEESVYVFLEGKIKLTDIAKVVEKGLEEHRSIDNPTYADILDVDYSSRVFVKNYFANKV